MSESIEGRYERESEARPACVELRTRDKEADIKQRINRCDSDTSESCDGSSDDSCHQERPRYMGYIISILNGDFGIVIFLEDKRSKKYPGYKPDEMEHKKYLILAPSTHIETVE